MNKLMLRLTIFWILLSGLSATDYKTEYQNQVHANIILKNTVISRDNKIKDLERDLKIQEVKEKERLLIYIPFTKVGVEKSHAIGFLVGFVVAKL